MEKIQVPLKTEGIVHTLGFWRERKTNAKTLLRPVRVVEERSDERIVLVVRDGIRVEGLSVEQLVEVLRQVR